MARDSSNVPANAWFTVPLDGARSMAIVFRSTIAAQAGITTVTSSRIRFVAFGLAKYIPGDATWGLPLPVGTATSYANLRALLYGTLLYYGSSAANAGAFDDDMYSDSTFLTSDFNMPNALCRDGAAPAAGDTISWRIPIGERNVHTAPGASLASGAVVTFPRLLVEGYEAACFAMCSRLSGTLADTSTLTMDAEMVAALSD